jgi:hypothetical protein
MENLESPLLNVSPQVAKKGHPVWAEISAHFLPAEFNRPYDMDVAFLRWLYRVRKRAGVPIRITSDARDPDGSVGAEKSAHKKRPCRAIDGQSKNSEDLARIIVAAIKEGCVRWGVYKSGKGLGDVYHLDAETSPENPSPRHWTKF